MLIQSSKQFEKNEMMAKIIQGVSLLNNYEEATSLVEALYNKTNVLVLSFINAHAYNLCFSDNKFMKALIQSDILLRDGIGMEILYKAIGKNPGENLNGTDYIPILINHFKGKKIALLGTKVPYLKRAAEKLSSDGHTVVLSETGFHPSEYYIPLLIDTAPDIIILGMGMPKQEKLSILIKEKLKINCIVINGGAIIDFWGDKTSRAPTWLRKMKMEWVFRFLQEPHRLFARYVIGNYRFLLRTRSLKRSIL
jgi:exopolysaccharide biosynthesis WecB/TagA/CpsF family protein